MDCSEADRFRAEPPELFHVFEFHNAWTDHRERSLFGESFDCRPVVFLCRLAGDASASTTDLFLELGLDNTSPDCNDGILPAQGKSAETGK